MSAGRPLLDIGPAGARALRWPDVRRQVIEAQDGRCANEACRRAARLDVVRAADGSHVGYCRRCRLLRDAPVRAAKARETRQGGVQLRLSGTARKARCILLPARALVDEALRDLAHGAGVGDGERLHEQQPEEGAWALIRVLRRCGVAFGDDPEASPRLHEPVAAGPDQAPHAAALAPLDGAAGEGAGAATCEARAPEPEPVTRPELAPSSPPVTDTAASDELQARAPAEVPPPLTIDPADAPASRSPATVPPATSAPAACVVADALDRDPASRLSVAEAHDMLAGLLRSIELAVPRLARLAAERLRLTLLVWICRARSIEERAEVSHEVALRVARIARQVSTCAGVFWCGYVPALQLTAAPRDTADLRGVGGTPPRTWAEAVQLAQRQLDEHLARAAGAGCDDDGWADGAAMVPAPSDSDAELERAVSELDARLGSAETPQGELHVPADLDLHALQRVAWALRWVRGRVHDPVTWGTAVGRLRRVLEALGNRGATTRAVLEPSFTPAAPWATLIAGGTEAESQGASLATLTAALPAAAESPESLLAWLIPAFDVLATPALAELLAPHRERVAALADRVTGIADRRARRRLRDLVRQLGAGVAKAPVAADAPLAAEVDPTDDEPIADRELAALCDRIRPHVQGRRVLFVSNRPDPGLEARLADLLHVQLTWCDGTLRRVQAQCARVGQRSYELVLCATGFLDHRADTVLARAAKTAKIPYVRVARGRPLACVQAIARAFGLLTMPSSDASRPAEARTP